MKKQGFTLVELLAVIAILAILVIIAMPNVLDMFTKARKNSFETEVKTIIKTTEKQWITDSMETSGSNETVYCRVDGVDCENSLNMSGNGKIDYYVKVDNQGNIIEFGATNDDHQFLSDKEGLKVEDVVDSQVVANLTKEEKLTITTNGIIINDKIIGKDEGIYVKTAAELVAAIDENSGKLIILENDIDGFSHNIIYNTKIDLNEKKLKIEGIRVNSDLTMINGTVSTDYNLAYIDIRPTENHKYEFKNVQFVNEYKRKNSPTNRIEYVLKLTTMANNVQSTFVFENSKFINASVSLAGLSDYTGIIDATFKNCTFNAITASTASGGNPSITIGNYLTGNITIENNTFNFECTKSYVVALKVSNSSSTTVTVNASNNKFNANKATAYTYDSTKGETTVDSINVNSTVKNCCFFDFRYLHGKYSTVNESGTILSGGVAVESIK